MAQTGYTPILIYSSSTTSNVPAAGNLTNSTLGSELAINITDGKLFYKDNANAVQVIGWKTTPTSAGGTGLTSYTAGDLLYYATGTTLSKLAIGTTGQWLGSSGTAPQWNSPAALTKTDDTNVTLTLGGSASTALLNAASLTLGWTGTLSVSRGGTGISTLATGYVPYGNGTGALSSSAKLTYDGTNVFQIGDGSATATAKVNGTAAVLSLTGSSFGQIAASTDLYLDSGSGKFIAIRPNGGTESARFFSSGGVSIGNTTDPGATNLSVNGKIAANVGGGNGGLISTSIYKSISTSTTLTCTISGLQYGTAEVTLGGYIPAGGGYFSIKLVLGGYQASTGTYDVTTLVNVQSGNAQIGAVTKNASDVTFTIRNNSGTQPLPLSGSILYISANPVSVTIA